MVFCRRVGPMYVHVERNTNDQTPSNLRRACAAMKDTNDIALARFIA